MTIASYSDLNTAVANWTGRGDLTSRIPEGIVLAEAKMNRYIRTKDMVTKNASFSITGEYVAVPSNFGGVKAFYLNTSPTQELVLSSDGLITEQYGGLTDTPVVYCIQGSNFRFGPVPSGTFTATLVYWLLVPALTGSATTNWVILSHPDVYLYGVLGEMAAFAKDFEAAQGWEAMFYKCMDELLMMNKRDRTGGGVLYARPG